MKLPATLFAVFIQSFAIAGENAAENLKIDPESITVSGISSGAAMAQQLHLAYPDLFSGAGLVAGVPWGCAEGSVTTALGRCTRETGVELPVDQLLAELEKAAESGRVGDLSLLPDDRAWVFHGALDEALGESVSRAAESIYAAHLGQDHIAWVGDVRASHNFPTIDNGHACEATESPYIGACGYDAAGEMLQFLYPGLETPGPAGHAPLQSVTLEGAGVASLAETAWLFVPDSCPEAGCRLHVALHGCLQSEALVGMQFMELAGYLPWAQANGIALAFPQVVASPVNPLGCWDWWGYTGANYLDRDAAQLKVIADWVRSLGK